MAPPACRPVGAKRPRVLPKSLKGNMLRACLACPREELTDNVGYAGRATAKEEMGVIGKEGPPMAGGLHFRKKKGQASDEVVSIPVIPEDVPSF